MRIVSMLLVGLLLVSCTATEKYPVLAMIDEFLKDSPYAEYIQEYKEQLAKYDIVKTKVLNGGYVVVSYKESATETSFGVIGIKNYDRNELILAILHGDKPEIAFENFDVYQQLDAFGKFTGNYENRDGRVFEAGGDASKDLETIAAFEEETQVAFLASKFLSYGMSEERSMKIASLLNATKKVGNRRALTNKDMDSFSKELFDTNYMTVSESITAIMQNDIDGAQNFLQTAAAKNNISPEQVQAIITDMF